MIDLKLIRQNPELVKEALSKLNTTAPIDQILSLDERRRALLKEVEELKRWRNRFSRRVGRLRGDRAIDPYVVIHTASTSSTLIRKGDFEGADSVLANPKAPPFGSDVGKIGLNKVDEELENLNAALREALGDKIEVLDEQLASIETQLNSLLFEVPNLPHESVPVGPDEGANVVVRQEGQPREFDFEPLPHWEVGPTLGIIDFKRGVKLSGSRFYVLQGLGAKLQRALITWMLDLHVQEHGYAEIYPPFMVKEECMWGAGQLPKFADNIYHDVEDDVWFIGTAEIPLTNLHRDEILEADQLPLYYVAYTPCFRRERMSAGRDVRGIKRGHQFDKVEMYKFTTPETSYDELERLVENAEDVCRRLAIPHRVVQMCTGDLGFSAAKKYDIEMWAPGCGEWLEVSSCSNCEAFQARRTNIRYRPEPGAKPEYVHTLNGSGLALPRTLIAVMENYQQADGSIVVPEVLRPYMGGVEVIK